MGLLIFGLVIIFILCGLPLFAAIGIIGILEFAISGIDPTVVIVELYRIASAPTLLAIPLFTLAGYVLAESRAPRRLLNLTGLCWVGFLAAWRSGRWELAPCLPVLPAHPGLRSSLSAA